MLHVSYVCCKTGKSNMYAYYVVSIMKELYV